MRWARTRLQSSWLSFVACLARESGCELLVERSDTEVDGLLAEMSLHPMVASAQGAEVRATGRAARMRDDVVVVALGGRT